MMSEKKQYEETTSDDPDEKFVLDQDLYAEVSCAANLREIRLTESRYSAKLEFFEKPETVAGMSHKYSGKCEELFIDKESGNAGGKFSWVAEIKSGRKNCLKLSAKYWLLYSDLGGHDEDHVCMFVTKIGRFATYPYFRALFANQVSESGLILPPLPTLNERVD